MKFGNPFAFRPGPVTFWTTVIYLAVIVPLLYVHETVPSAPADDALQRGLNLTEAWWDLQAITRNYHPYNSHENDRVRDFLIERSKQILRRNGAAYTTEMSGGVDWRHSGLEVPMDGQVADAPMSGAKAPGVTIFDDRISNVTLTYGSASLSIGQYFEGSNFYVYIHGTNDPEGDWWKSDAGVAASHRAGGVLVNCHFDSVSTGYGATDDGVSCVSMLQLLSYFTSEGRQPRHGIVLLFNNAEEDGLLGARAFGYSPLLKFCHTFVNLEGAGAGGRAMLFRTTDLQTAEAYRTSPHPFGSVVAANAFERGVIKSGTDYEVFAGIFGQRGLDIAFYEPRSRYHTEEDDARHTSVDSIWHMLSAALASTETLSKTTGDIFSGPRSDGRKDLAQNGRPAEGVWFDWFGSAWTTFPLRGLFAWSLTLLVATPLVLLIVTFLLIRNDKYYFFARDVKMQSELNDEPVALGGWRGFFRFPLAFVFAGASTFTAVYLLAKVNPLIVYSSGYAVWAMMISLFYFTLWLIMRGSNFVRPSALHRGFVLIWLFIITWNIQVIAAVAEDRLHIGAFYFSAFLHTAVFLSLLISLLEQFALPRKSDLARPLDDAHQDRDFLSAGEREDAPARGGGNDEANDDDEGDNDATSPTETTPLRAGEQGYGSNPQTTFASTYRRSVAAEAPAASSVRSFPPYEHEQSWSGRLPTWTWFLQLLLLVPVHLTLLGNLSLVQSTSMAMTSADGSSLLVPLMGIGVLSVLLLLPLAPFIHRVTHHIPVFLLLVFAGTLIYNLFAFPFSVNNRLKIKFEQTVDLDKGTNFVSLTGLEAFVRPVVASVPAASGREIECHKSDIAGLTDCIYDASSLPPDPADGEKFESLVQVTADKSSDGKSASLQISALNTKLCYLNVSQPIFGFSVEGGGVRDDRFGAVPADGFQKLQLWRRTWDGHWNVTLQLADGERARAQDVLSSNPTTKGAEVPTDGRPEPRSSEGGTSAPTSERDNPLEVTVRCAWDDANKAANIPALSELMKYMPKWAILVKKSTGLVQVRKTYKVSS